MKFRLNFIALSIILLASCETKNKNVVKHNDSNTTPVENSKHLLLNTFKNIPKEIDGCSCLFSETDQKFKKREYLFAAGFDSTAYIVINEKLSKFKLITSGREPNTFGDHDHVDIYQNDQFKLTVDIKYKRSSGDEVWQNEGIIILESKDGELKTTTKFVGECGC